MDRVTIPQPSAIPMPALEGDEELDTRRCGRCRAPFVDHPAGHGGGDWALCSACEAVLLPGRARRAAHLTLVPPPDGRAAR